MNTLSTLGCVALIAAMTIFGGLTSTAEAQESTPTPLTDLGLDASGAVGLIDEPARITWRAPVTVDHFRLTATLHAARVNRTDPLCTAPSQSETKTITIDEALGGTATQLEVPFPPLPESDAWFVFNAEVRLLAFDSAGVQIGAEGGGGVREAVCTREQPTATAAQTRTLPSTGTGAGGYHGDAFITIIVAASLLALLTARCMAWLKR